MRKLLNTLFVTSEDAYLTIDGENVDLSYKEFELLTYFAENQGMECCECGCCSYICPAKRQLTQSIKSMRKMVLAKKKK